MLRLRRTPLWTAPSVAPPSQFRLARPIRVVRQKHVVLVLVGRKFPQVIIEPAHRRLDHTVQGLRIHRGGHGHTPPDQRLDILKLDAKHGNVAGIRHVASVAALSLRRMGSGQSGSMAVEVTWSAPGTSCIAPDSHRAANVPDWPYADPLGPSLRPRLYSVRHIDVYLDFFPNADSSSQCIIG